MGARTAPAVGRLRGGLQELWTRSRPDGDRREGAAMAGKTVLVIADQEADRLYFERVVAEAGFRVRGIDAARDVLKVTRAERPDLILLNLVVDDMDGFKTCRELSLNPDTRDIPVLMLNDPAHRIDRLWAEQQGADGLLARPCSPEELLGEIERLI